MTDCARSALVLDEDIKLFWYSTRGCTRIHIQQPLHLMLVNSKKMATEAAQRGVKAGYTVSGFMFTDYLVRMSETPEWLTKQIK